MSGNGLLAAPAKTQILHGEAAVDAVEAKEGPLTPNQKRVVMLEGYATGTYRDTVRTKAHPNGVLTSGVGQTGPWLNRTFKEAYAAKERQAAGKIDKYKQLPNWVQGELVQAHYRGDLRQSPTAVKLFNQGKYGQAATEFLNHDEYRNTDRQQIKDRMESVSSAMWSLQP